MGFFLEEELVILFKILHSSFVKDPIEQVGAAVLRKHAKAVLKKDIGSRKLARVIAHMKKALKNEGFGVAIAAPQIGESLRMFVVSGKVFAPEGDETATPPDQVFLNPEFLRMSKKKSEMTEGCLSVRHKYGTVLRFEKASIKALNESGKSLVYHGSGLVAQIFQHEIDHLNGILCDDTSVTVMDDIDSKVLRENRKKT